jgi:hypothetical protein
MVLGIKLFSYIPYQGIELKRWLVKLTSFKTIISEKRQVVKFLIQNDRDFIAIAYLALLII